MPPYIQYPFILGKPKQGEVIKNVQCGYDVRKDQYVSLWFCLYMIFVWFDNILSMIKTWQFAKLNALKY